jgi:hypothetical protein
MVALYYLHLLHDPHHHSHHAAVADAIATIAFAIVKA